MNDLDSMNETVKDEFSARNASLWKWREARGLVNKLAHYVNHHCGFCRIAKIRAEGSNVRKCRFCPDSVFEYCMALQTITDKMFEEFQDVIESTIDFLGEFEPTDGIQEEK